MAYTISYSFDQFIENISIPKAQSNIASKRADAILKLLKTDFDILSVFPIGSMETETGLKNISDVDVMVVLHYSKHVKGKTPEQLLQDVRDVLSEYDTRMAKKNGQAITLYFKTWPNVDIVPACKVTEGNAFSHYKIPNINTNSWIVTDPKKHMAKILDAGNKKRVFEVGSGRH